MDFPYISHVTVELLYNSSERLFNIKNCVAGLSTRVVGHTK